MGVRRRQSTNAHCRGAGALPGRTATHWSRRSRLLGRIFHKLLLNFTWWVNRKDEEGKNLFQGGFLGLDNISVIDRSMTLPEGVTLEQSDGTAWMASYCLNMAWAALELSLGDPAYEDLGTKFLEHYLAIGGAMNGLGAEGSSLWDEEDGFITTTCDRRTVNGRR